MSVVKLQRIVKMATERQIIKFFFTIFIEGTQLNLDGRELPKIVGHRRIQPKTKIENIANCNKLA